MWSQVFYSVYQSIGGKNDSNSNTEWSQWQNIYQTVMKQVSNTKLLVKVKTLEMQTAQN